MISPRCVPCVTRFTFAAAMTLGASLADAQPPPPLPAASSSNSAAAKSGSAVAPSDDCGQCGKVLSVKQTMVKEQWTPLGGGSSFGSDARAPTTFPIATRLSNQTEGMVGAAGGSA